MVHWLRHFSDKEKKIVQFYLWVQQLTGIDYMCYNSTHKPPWWNLADTLDSKSSARNSVWDRTPQEVQVSTTLKCNVGVV